MSETQQPGSNGTEVTPDQAGAALAEIQQRQRQVINAALVPGWYWWVMGVAIVGIGAARDSGDLVVQAITIPLAVLVMAVLTGATIPEVRRRVKVHIATQSKSKVAAAIFGMILLVDVVIISIAATLAANHVHYPGTIGCAAGAAVLVTAGPLVNAYSRRLMLRQARQDVNDAPAAGDTP